jgi:quercetin dioxygenase-like cupin family protein
MVGTAKGDATPATKPVVHGAVLTTYTMDPDRTMWMIRLVLPPGAELPYWTLTGSTTIYVESGLLNFTAVTGTVRWTRGIDPVERTAVVTGQPTNLRPGDTVSFNLGAQHSMYNPILEPTSIVITMVGAGDAVPYDGLWTSEGYPIEVEA